MEVGCCNMTLNTTEFCEMDPENISNVSTSCSSSQNAEEVIGSLVTTNAVAVTVSLLSIISTSFALRILVLCKKTPLQIRYLSANFLVSFIMYDTSAALHALAILLLQAGDMLYMLIFDSMVLFGLVLIATTWGSLCAVSFDSVLALIFPFSHRRYAKKSVLKIVVIFIWVFNVLVPTTTLIVTIVTKCDIGSFIHTCKTSIYAILRPTRLVLSSFLSFYAVVIVISCVLILRVVFQRARRSEKFTENKTYLADLNRTQKTSKSTKTILMVVCAFLCFQSPIFFHSTVFEFMPQLQTHTWRRILLLLDYFGHQLNVYASLYIYIWKFKECRMHFYLILSRLNKKYAEAANTLRIELYDIVTKERVMPEQRKDR